MSEEGGGKAKTKRTHSAPKPYERRKSFLGKVTDTVKDLIAPSWLSDLVKSVKRNSPEKDEQDKVSDQQQYHVSSLPSNQQQYQFQTRGGPFQSSPPKFVPLTRNGLANLSPRSPLPLVPPQPLAQSSQQAPYFIPKSDGSQFPKKSPFQNSFVPDLKTKDGSRHFTSCTINKSDGMTNTNELKQSDVGTSQGLSEDDVPSTSQSPVCNHSQDMEDEKQDDSQVMSRTKLNKSTTWTEGFSSRKQGRNKPGFDVSLFGAPLHSNSLLGESFHESSFYPGKTMYGGASAQRKPRLNVTAPYQTSFPMRQKMKVKPASSSTSAATSSTAQKILETLEKMSTPLSDAKKIPVDDTVMRLNSSMNPTNLRPARHSIGTYLDTRRELQKSQSGPPRGKVNTPVTASISRNYQKITMPQVQSNKSSFSETAPKPMYKQPSHEEPDKTGGGKLKSKKFQQHLPSKRSEEDEDEVEIPNLRTDFTLPVKGLPQFNFGNSVASTANESKSRIDFKSGTVTEGKPDLEFTFSSPIQKTPTKKEDSVKPTKLDFTFSSPLNVDNNNISKTKSVTFDIKSDNNDIPTAFTSPAFKVEIPTGLSTKSPVNLGASPVLAKSSGGLMPATELKTGSVMDVLGKSSDSVFLKKPGDVKTYTENDKINMGGFKPATELKQGSVMDVLGKTSSKEDGTTFAGGFKPATVLKKGSVMDVLGKTATSEASKPSLASMFKVGEGSWDCDTCMINNKADVTKCAACGAKKPESRSSGTSAPSSQTSLSAMFKPAAGSWTCDTCMVQNKSADTKCVACQSNKPGSTGTPAPSSQPSLSAVFKPAAGSWTCDTCMLQNKPADTKCVACQANKPGSTGTSAPSSVPSLSTMFKPAAGAWTCDTCMVQNKSADAKCAACQSEKPGSTIKSSPKENLASKFKKPTGSWDCDTCLVPNTAEATKCIACETPRPGLQPSSFTGGLKIKGLPVSGQTGFVTQSGIKFGSFDKDSSDNTKSMSSSKVQFQFGMPSGQSGSSDSSKALAGVTGGITFGSGNITTPFTSSSSLGGFKFGTDSSTTNASTEGFKFGSVDVSKSSVSTSSFQIPSSVPVADKNKESTSAFKSLFGVDKSEISSAPTSESTSGKVSSGSLSQSTSNLQTIGFQFGVPTTQPPPYSAGSGFSHNKSEDKPDQANTMFNLPAPASTTSLKRSLNEENGPSDAKRTSFIFNSGTTTAEPPKPSAATALFNSTPVMPATLATSNSLFPTAVTSTSSSSSTSATAVTGGFNFGMGGNTGSSGGIQTTSFAPTTSSSGFSFGTEANKPPVFGFESNPATTTVQSGFGTSGFNTNSTGTAGTGGFFGGAKPVTTSAPAALFSFSGQSAAPAAVSQSMPTPFGSSQEATSTFGGANTSVFGNTPTNPFAAANATTSFGASGAVAPSGFGAAATGFNATSAGTAPAFGAATTSNSGSAGTAGFNFTSSQPAQGFQFGANAGNSASNGVFQFGAKSNESAPAAPQPTGGFTFGQSQSVPAAGAGGFNFNATTTPGSFNFSQTAAPPAGPGTFNIGADTGRKVKRAVRKIRR